MSLLKKLLDAIRALFGRKTTTSAPPAPSADWAITYSPNCPSTLKKDAAGMRYVNIPKVDGLHYVSRAAKGAAVGKTVTLTFAIEGSGPIKATQGDQPARVRLYMQKKGDKLTAAEQHKRWWSASYVDLVEGVHTLKAQLSPGNWSNVFGKNGAEFPAEFKACVQDLGAQGFTFGGTFAGHGVMAPEGNARFTLIEYSVE